MTTSKASAGVEGFPKGSEWRRWDMQIATILDDNYTPLREYSDSLKSGNPTLWQEYVAKVGGEADALLYDSATYFSDTTVTKNERCTNYVRNVFAFLETFSPDLAC